MGSAFRHASTNYQIPHDPQMESLLEAMKQAEGDLLEEELRQEEEGVEGVGEVRKEGAEACKVQRVEVELHPQSKEKQT